MEPLLFNRSERHIKSCAKIASFWAIAVIAGGFVTDLTGFHKSKVYSDPKPLAKVIQKWPFFLFLSFITFLVVFFWKLNEKEKIAVICPKCRDVVNAEVNEKTKCSKCNLPFENLEGFFDRHPEQR